MEHSHLQNRGFLTLSYLVVVAAVVVRVWGSMECDCGWEGVWGVTVGGEGVCKDVSNQAALPIERILKATEKSSSWLCLVSSIWQKGTSGNSDKGIYFTQCK